MNIKLISVGIVSVAAAVMVAHCLSQRTAHEFESNLGGEPQGSPHPVEAQDPSIAANLPIAEGDRGTDLVSEIEEISDSNDTDAALQATVKRVYSADSAITMAQTLDELALHDPEYADMRRRELSSFCHPEVIKHEGNASVRAGKENFCAGFDHTTYVEPPRLNVESLDNSGDEDIDALVEYLAHTEERQALNQTFRFEREIKAAIEAEPEANRSDAITELLRNARFPLEALMVGMYLETPGSPGISQWKFGEELRQSVYPQADLLNAQQVALYLYSCRQFGGCGRNQFLTMSYCSMMFSGKCRPGSSFEDVLYQTTPPADFGLAMEILGRL